MSYFAIQQKFAYNCKSTILQKKKKFQLLAMWHTKYSKGSSYVTIRSWVFLRYTEMYKGQKQN